MTYVEGEAATSLTQQVFEVRKTEQRAETQRLIEQQDRLGLTLLNAAREGIDDLVDGRVSVPGEAEPGEFYVEVEGMNFVVKVEPL